MELIDARSVLFVDIYRRSVYPCNDGHQAQRGKVCQAFGYHDGLHLRNLQVRVVPPFLPVSGKCFPKIYNKSYPVPFECSITPRSAAIEKIVRQAADTGPQ